MQADVTSSGSVYLSVRDLVIGKRVKEFKSFDSFTIARGKVFLVKNDEEFTKGKCPWMQEWVKIDGNDYFVIGVEAFRSCFNQDTPIVHVGATIGLLVGNSTLKE